MSETLAILLAAGAGTRFGGAGHKLDAELGGRTIASISAGVAVDAGVGPVVVVTGATTPVGLPAGVEIVHNPAWADGQATSLARAVGVARDRGASAIVVGLADQPFVTAEAWRLVAASTAPIAVATYDGQPRNPVRLAASVWSELPTTGDRGARDVIRFSPDRVEAIPCSGSPADIDTREDLQQWQNKSSTNSP